MTESSITLADLEAACFREALHAFGMREQPQDAQEFIDMVEAVLVEKGEPAEAPLKHQITPGLYSRTVLVPRGTVATSKTHNHTHQFVLMVGEITVWSENNGWQLIRAPFQGITLAGTRRIVYAHSDCVWATYHPTEATTLEELEEELIMKHDNKFLEGGLQ